MKIPKNQNQHKVPQVYLKQFGYDFKGHKKVSVLKLGEKFTRQKSIKGFLSETNVFKIESQEPEITNIFEEFNSDLENEFLNILADLESSNQLSDKSQGFIFQLIPNLICRTDGMRNIVRDILYSDAKTNFLTVITFHKAPDKSLDSLLKADFFIMMNNPPVDESIINKALIFLSDHIFRKLAWYDIVILQSQDGKPWFTSDNPVIFENRKKKFDLLLKESEVYFPLSPKYLLYVHHNESKDQTNELRKFEKNKIYIVNDEDNVKLQQKIMRNAYEHVIIAGKLKYTISAKK